MTSQLCFQIEMNLFQWKGGKLSRRPGLFPLSARSEVAVPRALPALSGYSPAIPQHHGPFLTSACLHTLPRFSAAPMCRDESFPGGVDVTWLAQLCSLRSAHPVAPLQYTVIAILCNSQALLSVEFASVVF